MTKRMDRHRWETNTFQNSRKRIEFRGFRLTRDEAAACVKPLYITGGPGWRPERPKG
ncbi:hypothetical protein [Paenibacillus pseudetheri]|uniref:hypothetical protein n=1 Tax=Paenibacillus pseudetheri TaxID=2897682 RepID=UPI001F1DD6F2|nr:hypothetical protein [Paenibacillus pseudetheri]